MGLAKETSKNQMRYPWLKEGITAEEALRMIEERIREFGWKIVQGKHLTRSMANPFTKKVVLRAGIDEGPNAIANKAILLGHETRHIEQWGRVWWKRWFKALLYVRPFNPLTRFIMEVQAEGMEAAIRYRLLGYWEVTADLLSGNQKPYYIDMPIGMPQDAAMGEAKWLIENASYED